MSNKNEKLLTEDGKKTMVAVGVFDNSTDWGRVGTYPTLDEALREGRKFAEKNSFQRGYAGYGPVIRLAEVDEETGEALAALLDVRAW